MTGLYRIPIERVLTGCTVVLASGCMATGPLVEAPKLGTPLAADVVTVDALNVFPDGRGLPNGRGTVAEGASLFAKHCAACHGRDGRGGSAEELVGASRPLDHPDADKTIGSYWPHATTVFDFIRRAKPMNAPGTLDANDVYALSAWLLHVNGVIAADAVMDAQTLPAVRMPNRDGFIRIEGP
jgi:mono/diheme cytochrome c family protein